MKLSRDEDYKFLGEVKFSSQIVLFRDRVSELVFEIKK